MVRTKDKIAELRKEHPEWSMQQIGDTLGVTRQMVHQTLKKANLPTRRVLSSQGETRPQSNSPMIQLLCNECGRVFDRSLSSYKSAMKDPRYKGVFYCNRICLGKRVGRLYGQYNLPKRKANPGDRIRFQNGQYGAHLGHTGIVIEKGTYRYKVACNCGKEIRPTGADIAKAS